MTASCILGLGGTRLNANERAFFAEADPLGFILFARNVETPDQVRQLVRSLRELVGRPEAPVLIDQEGGRVARLRPPRWRLPPSAGALGELFRLDPDAGLRAGRLNARLIGAELFGLGITVDCAPVLDVLTGGSDSVMGDRAFSSDPAAVTALGGAFCDGLLAAGVLPVIKHIPGLGRGESDSHFSLPRVAAGIDELAARDLVPFAALAQRTPRPWAMTTHVAFEALDPGTPATVSAAVIGRLVRGKIGFDGVIVSDDLSMKALSGPMSARARAARAAGCDIVLHCNGEVEEMAAVAEEAGLLSPETAARLEASLGAVPAPEPFDPGAAERELGALLAPIDGTAA